MAAGGGRDPEPTPIGAHWGRGEANPAQWKRLRPVTATGPDDLPQWGVATHHPLGTWGVRKTRGPTPPKNKDCVWG